MPASEQSGMAIAVKWVLRNKQTDQIWDCYSRFPFPFRVSSPFLERRPPLPSSFLYYLFAFICAYGKEKKLPEVLGKKVFSSSGYWRKHDVEESPE